jgi:hypothetical protein
MSGAIGVNAGQIDGIEGIAINAMLGFNSTAIP